jgi:hypothetical protein
MGWVKRNGNNSGVETAEKSGDELQSRGVEEQCAFSTCLQTLETGANSPRFPVQICIGQVNLFCFSIFQERTGHPIRLVECSPAKDFNQRGRLEGRL